MILIPHMPTTTTTITTTTTTITTTTTTTTTTSTTTTTLGGLNRIKYDLKCSLKFWQTQTDSQTHSLVSLIYSSKM